MVPIVHKVVPKSFKLLGVLVFRKAKDGEGRRVGGRRAKGALRGGEFSKGFCTVGQGSSTPIGKSEVVARATAYQPGLRSKCGPLRVLWNLL